MHAAAMEASSTHSFGLISKLLLLKMFSIRADVVSGEHTEKTYLAADATVCINAACHFSPSV